MPTLNPGHELGRFCIESFIGSGGMADVYRATSPTRGTVAIKVPKIEGLTTYQQGAMLKRFGREAFALARLHHRGIVEICEVNAKLPSPFLAMEYLDGLAPFEWGRPVGATISDWLLVGREICEALAFAHSKNILHRDLKAANIIILGKEKPSAQSLFGRVKLIDWGIMQDRSAHALTDSGLTPGTLGAIDPAVLNRTASFSPQSDLYALGAFLYQALTGQSHLVLGEDKTVDRAWANQENAVRPARALNTAIPESVEKLLGSLLGSEPRARPAGAAEVATLLLRLANKKESDLEDRVAVENADKQKAYPDPKTRVESTEKCAMEITRIAPSIVYIRFIGFGKGALFEPIISEVDRIVSETGSVEIFADTEDFEKYDTELREKWASWLGRNPKARAQALITRGLIRMAANVINMASDIKIKSYSNRADFEAAIRARATQVIIPKRLTFSLGRRSSSSAEMGT